MKIRQALPVLLALVCAASAAAGPVVRHFDRSQGLGNNYIMDIEQDRNGFVWLSTESGLNRFDGAALRPFTSKNSGLGADALNRLYADRDSNYIWVATQRFGLDRLDCDNYTFTSFRHDENDSRSIASDGVTAVDGAVDGGLWIATYTDGLDYFDKKTGVFTHYNSRTVDGWPGDRLWRAVADNSGNVYLGHVDAGFTVFRPSTGEFHNFRHRQGDSRSLPADIVQALYIDRNNNVWIGTDSGLSLYNPFDNTFTNFRHDPANKASLISDRVLDISQTNDGNILVATENGGLSILMLPSGSKIDPWAVRFVNFPGEVEGDMSLSNKTVHATFCDSFGNIWAGTYGDGADVISMGGSPFTLYNTTTSPFNTSYRSVMSLCSTGESLWAGTDGKGADLFGPSGREDHLGNLGDNAVLAILRTSRGDIWFGTYGGFVFRLPAGSASPERVSVPGAMDVRCFAETPSGSVLVGHGHGIADVSADGSVVSELVPDDSLRREEWVRSMWADNQGRLWIGSFGGGLAVYDRSMKPLKIFTTCSGLRSNTVNQLLPDGVGGVWAATGDGIAHIRPNLDLDMMLGTGEGLAGSYVRSVVKDHAGNLWMSTDNGLSMLDTGGQIHNIGEWYGVLPDDFNSGAAAITADGRLFFGSHTGILELDPANFDLDIDLPPTVITSATIFGRESEREIFSPKGRIAVPYNQNTIRVSFDILNASLASSVSYCYKVEGQSDRWYPCTAGNSILLSNLSPGDYNIVVKAVAPGGGDEGEPAVLSLKVNAPLWGTWWAKLFYILLALAVILFLVHIYKKRMRLEYDLTLERRNMKRQQDLTAERMRFFTNITHELRTPLTLILGPLEDMKSDPSVPAAVGKKIGLIHRSALRLLELINTILEFRKTETQNRQLKVQCADISGIIREIGARYKEFNTNRNLTIDTSVAPGTYRIWFDPEVISMIVDNLMSNACKYTASGRVELKLYHAEESGVPFTEIAVSDTGIGMENDTLGHIFERYYRDRNVENCLGTGIGLALVYNLVKIHHGEIFVESEPHRGTTFRVRLHTENCYPDAERRDDLRRLPAADSGTDSSAVEADEGKPVILVVEDNIDIINYISEVLADSYRVVSATNGAMGLAKARDIHPDMVITDIMMPEMDGVAMTKELKSDPLTSYIPIIVITAKTASEARLEAYEAKADSFISKPFSSRLLLTRIRNIFETRHSLAVKAVELSRPRVEEDIREALPETPKTDPAPEQSVIVSGMSEADADFIEKVKSIIIENMAGADLDVQFIADRMAMSHSTLYRKVKAITGLTINNLIRKCRAREAQRLLVTGRYTVSEISYMVGVSSPGNFRQCFREEFGVNPSDYLKSLKNENS